MGLPTPFHALLANFGSAKSLSRALYCTLGLPRPTHLLVAVLWVCRGQSTCYSQHVGPASANSLMICCALNLPRPTHAFFLHAGPAEATLLTICWFGSADANLRATCCTLGLPRPLHAPVGARWVCQSRCARYLQHDGLAEAIARAIRCTWVHRSQLMCYLLRAEPAEAKFTCQLLRAGPAEATSRATCCTLNRPMH